RDRGERAIGDGLAGGGAVAEDEGMVVGDYGNGAVRIFADQELARLLRGGRLAAPEGRVGIVGIHARSAVGVAFSWMPPPVFETDRLRYARGMPHVLPELSAVVRGGHGEGGQGGRIGFG